MFRGWKADCTSHEWPGGHGHGIPLFSSLAFAPQPPNTLRVVTMEAMKEWKADFVSVMIGLGEPWAQHSRLIIWPIHLKGTLRGEPFLSPAYSGFTMASNEDFFNFIRLALYQLAPVILFSPIPWPQAFLWSWYVSSLSIMPAITSVQTKSRKDSSSANIFYPLLPYYYTAALLSISPQYYFNKKNTSSTFSPTPFCHYFLMTYGFPDRWA